jgi:hypothetical protein
MRPVHHLAQLYNKSGRRLLLLRTIVENYKLAASPDRERAVVFVTIEALNLWSSFIRSFYLSCVFNAISRSGVKIVVGAPIVFPSHVDAIRYSIKQIKGANLANPRRINEPSWYDPQVLLRLTPPLKLSNSPSIHAAFSVPNDVLANSHLRICRNFFAHRNEETAANVANVARYYGRPPDETPSQLLCAHRPHRPQCILADWLDELRLIGDTLCQ